jgi:DNA polymerase-3 subunit gamma/tau
VSFSNGALTYENTLEHLNILDEAYFFKLLDHLTKQDLTQAMLLYDEINQKGFEGDMVLYGLASFIRNLLVCKDPASAKLLESIEGWREQYISVSKEISTPYLVSALNLLNEAEIQFKMARNKRLHVEMAIIKLNFLQQAIELSMEDSQVVKKKLVDSHYPIRLKKIIPLSNSVVTKEAKLIIEQPSVVKPAAAKTSSISSSIASSPTTSSSLSSASASSASSSSASAGVSASATTTNTTTSNIPSADPTQKGSNKNLLAVLQNKYGEKYKIEEVIDSIPLTMDDLRKCWDDFTLTLETALKHSAASTFKLAQLEIENETHFTITVPALTAQKFVEQERMNVLERVWEHFHNRAIQFSILVAASEKEDVPLHLSLNSKQKYERIAAQYPLVQELKTRLNLEIYY